MRRFLVLLIAIFMASTAPCTTWVWMSTDDYIEGSSLIAVLDIGPVHNAYTAEGIAIQSATAKLVKCLYWQFSDRIELPKEVVVYCVNSHFDPEGDVSPPLHSIRSTRVLAALRSEGSNKFIPYAQFSLQEIDADGKVMWPSAPDETERMSIEAVEGAIREAMKRRKKN